MAKRIEDLTTEEQATFRSEIGVNIEYLLALLDTPSSITVNATGTDLERGAALVAAYTSAKVLTPNGSALSATNRAMVILPPGKYKVATTFVLDGEFVDLVAQSPTPPSRRRTTDDDPEPTAPGLPDFSSFRPQPTMIYCEAALTNTVRQNAADVRLYGFTIAQTGEPTDYNDLGQEWGAFYIGDVDNSPSHYEDMYFWCGACGYAASGGVRAYENFAGTWINCVANSCSFRLGYGDQITPSAVFSATMIDCEAGPFSFIGDYFTGRKANYSATGAKFYRCKGVGKHQGIYFPTGDCCFAGCTTVGVAVASSCWFYDCEAGFNSFGLGSTNNGNYIRCRAGSLSFGASGIQEHALSYGTGTATDTGSFLGYAEDCIGGKDSFGHNAAADGIISTGGLKGTLVRCTITGNTRPLTITGAKIRDSRITVASTGVNAIEILDSNSVISNCELIVLQGGTGIPVYADTSLDVAVYGCRMNNATNDADGLAGDVTNLVSSAGNVVSNSIT